jgi:hypothetical protein
MDEASVWMNQGGWTTVAPRSEEQPSAGKLWTFVEAGELRRLLARLIAAELVRLSLADACGGEQPSV